MTGVYYSQNNDSRWKNYVYSKYDKSRTIATSGCGVVSPAMVLSSLLKRDIFPPEIAKYSLDHGHRVENVGTAQSLYPALAKEYGLEFKFTTNINTVIQWLKDGGMVVMGCKGSSTGIFSTGGHIIALMGYSNGNIIVHDPYLYNGKFNAWYRKPYVSYSSFNLVKGMDIFINPSRLDTQRGSVGYNCFKAKKEEIDLTKAEFEQLMSGYMPKVYNSVAECPDWGRPTVQKLVDKGYLQGEIGKLGLPEDLMRILVINDRAGLYDSDVYNTVDEVPDWGKETVQKMIDKGYLQGGNGDKLGITTELLRVFVTNDRAGLYK